MRTPIPTGKLSEDGSRLTLERTFGVGIEDVWAAVSEPARTARWFADWQPIEGDDSRVRYQMLHEEGSPEGIMTIEACEPPSRLVVITDESIGSWRLELTLTAEGDRTRLRLTHHLDPGIDVGDVGPGWEYYLDMLTAAEAGEPLPSFEDYYPAQRDHYTDQR